MSEQERLPAWLGLPLQDRSDLIRAPGTALPGHCLTVGLTVVSLSPLHGKDPIGRILPSTRDISHHLWSCSLCPSVIAIRGREGPPPRTASAQANPTRNHRPKHCSSHPGRVANTDQIPTGQRGTVGGGDETATVSPGPLIQGSGAMAPHRCHSALSGLPPTSSPPCSVCSTTLAFLLFLNTPTASHRGPLAVPHLQHCSIRWAHGSLYRFIQVSAQRSPPQRGLS